MFLLGFIVGLIFGICIAILNVAVLIYFRHPITQKIEAKEVAISNAGPRPKAVITMPKSEGQESRERVIAENRDNGRDTPFNQLRS